MFHFVVENQKSFLIVVNKTTVLSAFTEDTLMEKLKKYGFSDYIIENLMKGKIVTTAYGKVKYNSKSGILTTFYPDGRIKEETL